MVVAQPQYSVRDRVLRFLLGAYEAHTPESIALAVGTSPANVRRALAFIRHHGEAHNWGTDEEPAWVAADVKVKASGAYWGKR